MPGLKFIAKCTQVDAATRQVHHKAFDNGQLYEVSITPVAQAELAKGAVSEAAALSASAAGASSGGTTEPPAETKPPASETAVVNAETPPPAGATPAGTV